MLKPETVSARSTEPRVIACSEGEHLEWDNYVARHPAATIFHGTAWQRVIQRAFGYKPVYLTAREGSSIRGVLPLFIVDDLLFGRRLISTPFAVYGGICASDAAAESAIQQEACRLAQREQAGYLELRCRRPSGQPGFHNRPQYVTFDRELPPDPDLLFNSLPRNIRNMIRKAAKNGLEAVVDNRHLDVCYEIYARSVHHLGTPVFARKFFNIILEEFREAVEITTIWKKKAAVAAVLSFRFRDWIVPYYGGSTTEGRALAANNFMYWEVMRMAAETGLRRFDFGRSKLGTGAYHFKTHWKMRERALDYDLYPVRRKILPNHSPANPRFQFAIDSWKRMPFSLTKVLGPAVVRLFP